MAYYYFVPEDKLSANVKIDKLVVLKSKRIMHAYQGKEIIKTFTISLGRNPIGHKQFEGDKRTPEGIYKIDSKNPDSGYHKNLGISYPDQDDIAFAKKNNQDPGGAVKIHGLKNGQGWIGKFHRFRDWTAGCIALTDEEVDELYDHVNVGAVIEIRP